MANRTPVSSGLGRARIQPVAAPVDTYTREQPGFALNQLAESLKGVAPEVAKYSDVVAQQQSESQKAAGEQKAREMFDSGVSYKDAIKKGLITPDQSPWFQLGAKEQFGRVTAGRFSTDLQNAVEQNPQLQESTDVAQYDQFATQFKKQWLDQNVGSDNRDLNFEHGFGSMSDAYSEDSRRQFVAQAGARLVKSVGDNHYGEVFTNAKHELAMNTDHKAIGEGIQLANERFAAMGGDPTVANRAVVKAIGDLALQTGDVSVLDILTHVKAGNQTLDARPWAQKEIQTVTHQVFEDKQARHRADAEAQTEATKTAIETQTSGITDRLLKSANPSREDITADLATLNKLSPAAAENVVRFKETMTGAKFASDTTSVQGTLANIFTKQAGAPDYVDVHTLVGLVNAHQINQQDFSYLKSQIDSRDEAARREENDARTHNPFTDPQFSHSMTSLTQQITAGKPDEMWTPEVMRRANGAQSEMGTAWLEYMSGPGQKATYLEKHDFLEKMVLKLTPKWQPANTKRGANQPSVPQVDLRTPAMREQVRRMANLMDSQARNNTGFSPGVMTFMRANGITDAAAFVKQHADH